MLNIEYYKDELKEIIIRNIGINAITGIVCSTTETLVVLKR